MIRTNIVKLTTLQAMAYGQKLKAGDIGIVIVRPDKSQPGIAAVNKKTGELTLLKNINEKDYPIDAFKEAMELTYGLPFKKQGIFLTLRQILQSRRTWRSRKHPSLLRLS